MSDLLDRLRAVESSRGDSDYVSNWHRNPDGPDAANEIEKLRGIIRGTATLTDAEREAVRFAAAAALPETEKLGGVAGELCRMHAATLRGLLERLGGGE